MHSVHSTAVVLISNAGERLLTEQMPERQVAISIILGLNLNTELCFKNCYLCACTYTIQT